MQEITKVRDFLARVDQGSINQESRIIIIFIITVRRLTNYNNISCLGVY